MFIGGQRDGENIAGFLGFLEMPDMTDVQQVENAVALDDLAALTSMLFQNFSQIIEALYFFLSLAGEIIILQPLSTSRSQPRY